MCTSMQNKQKNARNMNKENGERPQENIKKNDALNGSKQKVAEFNAAENLQLV